MNSKLPCKRKQHFWSAAPNIVECYMLRPFAHPVACCCTKSETGQTQFESTTPKISFVLCSRSVAQQCWIRLHSSSNVVMATHAHYTWFTTSLNYGLYPSHDALQVPTYLRVIASVGTQRPARTANQLNNVGSYYVRSHIA